MLHIRVLTLQEKLYEGEVSQITAPGTEGEFTVLPGHLPFLTTLAKGSLKLVDQNREEHFVEIETGGMFELDGTGNATALLN
ncbi:MAG: hypothetical protein WDZ44_00095 [Candidatus Spechtbacterales bacterium]